MRLLVDSQILLWLDLEPDRILDHQRKALADVTNDVFVSAASAWELGIKHSKGKIKLNKSVSEQRALFGFLELPVTFAHAEFAAGLPFHHKDPFDRMLVAQAILEDLLLVSSDRRLKDYPVAML